jgi:uncharacterized protein YunC (DUF1805 family)
MLINIEFNYILCDLGQLQLNKANVLHLTGKKGAEGCGYNSHGVLA